MSVASASEVRFRPVVDMERTVIVGPTLRPRGLYQLQIRVDSVKWSLAETGCGSGGNGSLCVWRPLTVERGGFILPMGGFCLHEF